MTNKFLTLLGFAMKSGNIITGESLCELNVKKHKISLLIISEDASDNTKKKFTNLCEHHGVKYIVGYKREDLSQAIGKFNRPVVGVANKQFTRSLIEANDGHVDGPEETGGEADVED
jgi:ribosomal protein L7Ae-like RNA K-turn-binding protein